MLDKEAVLAFFAGAALAAIGAAVWTGKRYKRELDKLCDEYDAYIDEIMDKWNEQCANCQLENEDDIVEDDDIEPEECDAEDYEKDALVDYLNTCASLEDHRDENGIIPYDKISVKNKKEETEVTEVDESNNGVKASEDRFQDKFLEEDEEELTISYISQEEYEDTPEDFEQLELTYLEGSDVFLTEDDEKYNAYPAIGGRGNLEEALAESGNGVVYIRNEALEIDFCITSDVRDYDTYIEETSTN